jgi:hypothetical protein
MSMNDPTADGQHALGSLLGKRGDGSVLANELVLAFHRGFPIDNLRPLLESEDPELVRHAAWIQSELGARGRPLARFLPRLLQNEQKYVRFFALDSVITCATATDGALVAAAVKLVGDPEDAVRWKAIKLLKVLPEGLLRSALLNEQDDSFRQGLESLLSGDIHRDVPALLESQSPILRRFGVAAALRSDDCDLLKVASESEDREVGEIAREELSTRQPKR